MKNSEGTVLIVDDTPENIRVLGEILEQEGYEVFVAENGLRALDILNSNSIDLVLLDVMMPEMDGFEVCRRIKATAGTASIPVIFLTALDYPEDEERGLSLGAVDYITKPFKVELVRARVDTHISLFHARERLEQTVNRRTLQLAESYAELRNLDAARQDLLQILYKKLWDPQTGLFGITEAALAKINPSSPYALHLKENYRQGRDDMVKFINSGLFLSSTSKSAGSGLRPMNLNIVVNQVLMDCLPLLKEKKLTPVVDTSMKDLLITADMDLFYQIFLTVIQTAAALGTQNSSFQVEYELRDGKTLCRVVFKPLSPVPDSLDALFDPDQSVWAKTPAAKLGLQITLASRIALALGIEVKTESDEIQLKITLSMPSYEKKGGYVIALPTF